jgi:iron complex outermembrane receptor protein
MFRRTKVCTGLMVAFGGTLALTPPIAFGQTQLERVEITGSSIRRVDAETALPVQIITKEEIARTGVVSTEQLLQSISATSSQGGISSSMGAGNSTYGQASISLRGLGEDRTLVLVNGRRLAAFASGNGASVNVNAIPIAAIERVEVLKDGASGIYGSDAIAGVVNFILTKDYQGVELGASYGTPTQGGGGKSKRATLVAGFGDGSRFNVTLSGSFEKETALFAKDRSFAKTGNVPPFLLASATGQGNIQGSYTPGTGQPGPIDPATGLRQETGVAGPRFGNTAFGNPLGVGDNCASVNMFLNPTPSARGAPYCQFDSNAFVGLIPDRKLTTFSGNLSFKVNDSVELFGDALYSKSVVIQTFQPSPLRRDFMQTDNEFANQGVDPVLLIRPGNPAYQTAVTYLNAMEAAHPGQGFAGLIGQPLATTARVFTFGPRSTEDTGTQTRVVAGVRGVVAKQNYEVGLSTNESKVEGKTVSGYFSQVNYAKVVNSATSNYNPWSLTQSQAFNDAAAVANYVGPTLVAKSKSDSIDAKLTGDVLQLPAGPLQYAAGFQYRKEHAVLSPSAALLSGDIAGLGGATPPIDRERKVTSVFGELNVPIVKSLEGNLALRNDRYNDVGRSTNYKGSLRWQPIQAVVVRGSLGSGFRAPTLVDLWAPVVLGASEQFNDPVTGETDLQVNSFTGGFSGLKPEKSKQRTIGLVVSPVKDLSFSVDYFNIKVNDLIALESAQAVVSRNASGDPAYANLVVRDPTSNEIQNITQLLRNVGDAKVQGLDIEASWRLPVASGRLDLNLAGTYMMKFDSTTPSGVVSHKVGTTVEPNGDPVLSSNNNVQDGIVLRWKHYLSATYTQRAWSLTLAQNFYKGYRDGNDLDGNEHRVPSQSLYDANLAYTGVKNLKLAVGVRNLFDKDPPLFIPTSNQFQAGYDITQYDPRGRFVYVTASYKFF